MYLYFQLGLVRLLLSFNRTKSRVVTGLLSGHNTFRRHIYIMGLIDSPLWSMCRTEEETSAHVLCDCEAVATLGRTSLGSFFLDPNDISKSNSGTQSGTLVKQQGSHDLDIRLRGAKNCVKKPYVHRDGKGSNQFTILFYSIFPTNKNFDLKFYQFCNFT